MPIRRPDHGCHGYSSSRNLVLWAFSSLVVQRGATSQRDRQQSPDRANRSVRNTRPALTETFWKRPAAWSKDGEQSISRTDPRTDGPTVREQTKPPGPV